MKADYLSELLKDNKTVILPGIGAFVNNSPAVPSVTFNPYLKFNDGLLVSFISKKENSSAEDAGKKLDVFINGLISLLESGRDVSMKNLGKLKMDADRKIIFTYDSTSAETVLTPEEKPKPEPVKEIIIEKKPEEKIIPEEKPVVKEDVKKEAIPQPVSKPEVKVEKEKIAQAVNEKRNLSSEGFAKEGTSNLIPLAIGTKTARKKSRSLVWIILLIVILGGGGTAGYIYKDKLMELAGISDKKEETAEVKENEPVKEKVKEEPEIVADTLAKTQDTISAVTTEVIEETIQPSTFLSTEGFAKVDNSSTATTPVSSGTYYVIVGCYSQPSNAEAMMTKITEKGNQPINLGTYNGLIHIAAFQSDNLNEAANKAMELRSTYGKVWIFQKK